MLTIRLTRKGKKNQPFFKIVVIDKRRSAKGGRAVEELGYVNPLTKKHSLEKDRILYWISKGAKPTPRIHNLLVSEKVIEAKKIKVFSVTKKAKASAVAKAMADKEAVKVAAAPVTPAEEVKAPEVAPVLVETPASPADLSAETSAKEEAPKSEGVTPVETPKEKAKAEPEKTT